MAPKGEVSSKEKTLKLGMRPVLSGGTRGTPKDRKLTSEKALLSEILIDRGFQLRAG